MEKITRRDADLRLIREYASINFSDKTDYVCDIIKPKEFPHYKIFQQAKKLLENKGFKFFIDRKFEKEYSCLIKSHSWAIKERLRLEMEIYPAGFKIEFYQNVNHKNPCGGKYDFDKYKRMPKRHKLMFNAIAKYLIGNLCKEFNLKFYDQSEIRFPRLTAEQVIIKHIQECSFDRCNQTKLSQTANFMEEYDFKSNSNSGVGDKLKCGEIRKFKDYNGKISKGKIYHNINNMWWIIKSKYKYRNIGSFNILEKVKTMEKEEYITKPTEN